MFKKLRQEKRQQQEKIETLFIVILALFGMITEI